MIIFIIISGKPESVQNCSVINESTDSFQVNCYPGFNGGLPQHFTLAVYKVTGAGGGDLISLGGQATERKPTANLSSTIPRFEVSGLEPGSKYIGELVGHNVKGAGDAKYIHVYTLKLPEKLIPQLEEPNHNSGEIFNVTYINRINMLNIDIMKFFVTNMCLEHKNIF